MKKQIFAVLLVVLITLYLTFPVLAVSKPNLDSPLSASATALAQEYVLPYPGILPDNPLYVFKAMRDRIISWLIADSKKRALFDLLQADKRLQSAVYLLEKRDKKHIRLAESTLSKGENYFEEAIGQLQYLKKQDLERRELLRRLQIASYKHQEVIYALSKQIPENETKPFDILKQRITTLSSRLDQLVKEY